MEITLVKIFPVQEEKLKAFVSVVFDSCFMVNDIKVIQGKDGLFLSMPSRRKKSGEFKDVAHPLNNATRRMLEERVLMEYRAVVEDATPRRPDRETQPERVPAVGLSTDLHGPKAAVVSIAARESVPVVPEEGNFLPVSTPNRTDSSVLGTTPKPPQSTSEESEAVPTTAEKTLEEVQEIHLSDSFWSVS
jgi:stage V sporulation protein G